MKDLNQFTTKQDLADWKEYFLLVENIPDDSDTKLKRSVAANGPFIDAARQVVEIFCMVYNLDADGNPINGLIDLKRGNIVPRVVLISANNSFYIDLRTPGFKVLRANEIAGLQYGKDYIEEFEAYRLYAKGNPIDIFALMENSIRQSSLI